MATHRWVTGVVSRSGHPQAKRTPLRALVAVPFPASAGLLAQALQRDAISPTLAFSRAELIRCLERDRYQLLVIHRDLVGADGATFMEDVRLHSEAAVMELDDDDMPRVELQDVDERPIGHWRRSFATHVHDFVDTFEDVLDDHLEWGSLRLDLSRREAWWQSKRLPVTPLQLRILAVLTRAQGAVVTPREIARAVWGTAVGSDADRLLAHVRRLRRKLEARPAKPEFILTVRGEGFRLADPYDRTPDDD